MPRSISVTLLALVLLVGCGIKGPLRPPPAPADAAAQGASASPPASAEAASKERKQ